MGGTLHTYMFKCFSVVGGGEGCFGLRFRCWIERAVRHHMAFGPTFKASIRQMLEYHRLVNVVSSYYMNVYSLRECCFYVDFYKNLRVPPGVILQ